MANFEERWLKASKPRGIKKLKATNDALLKLEKFPDILGAHAEPCLSDDDPEGWHVQIFRSIDSNSVKGFPKDPQEATAKSYIGSLNQFISPSPATPSPLTSQFLSTSPAESTPLSSIATAEMTPLSSPISAEAVTISVPSHYGATTDEMNLLNVEEVVKNLRVSMFQVLHSADIEPRFKNILDALVKMVNEEFHSLHEERNIVVELFSKKIRIVLPCFVLGMLAVSAGLFIFSDVQGYDHGYAPPT